MPFEPGKSGNPNGRPTNLSKDTTPAELKACLAKLKRHGPKAIDMLIDAMFNEKLPETTRLKYAEKIAQFLLAFSKEANKGTTKESGSDEEPAEKAPVVQFSLVKNSA